MQLKCFGGPHDQTYSQVNNNLQQGDAHRIRETPKFAVMDYIPSYEEMRDGMTMKYHVYIVERIQHYKFLRYEKLSIRDVLDKIFT